MLACSAVNYTISTENSKTLCFPIRRATWVQNVIHDRQWQINATVGLSLCKV